MLLACLFFYFSRSHLEVYQEIENKEQLPVYEKFTGYYQPPIFSFHHISSAPSGVSKNIASLYIEPDKFEQILINLKENNYKTVFVSEIVDLLGKNEKSPSDWVAITFDDGNIDFYDNVFPLLKKHNIKTSLYIMTGARGKNYMSPEQIKEVSESELVEIGSHTVYHPNLTNISSEKVKQEVVESKKYLEELLGKDIYGFCYPFGDYNELAKNAVREAGYKYALSYNHRPKDDITDLFEINRTGVWAGMNIMKFLQE